MGAVLPLGKWYFGQCPVFAPGMPLATIREPAGFRTFPLAYAPSKEPFPGEFASFFVISKNRNFEPIFGTDFGPILGTWPNFRMAEK